MAKMILCDACYWIALFDSRDANHDMAMNMFEHLDLHKVMTPYPVLYEVLGTRFAKHETWLTRFDKILQRHNFKICDLRYRDVSINEIFRPGNDRALSLVDTIIRNIIQDNDRGFQLHALVTFNTKDFSDVCNKKRIELVNQNSFHSL